MGLFLGSFPPAELKHVAFAAIAATATSFAFLWASGLTGNGADFFTAIVAALTWAGIATIQGGPEGRETFAHAVGLFLLPSIALAILVSEAYRITLGQRRSGKLSGSDTDWLDR
jgi:hypothetical protein